MRVFVTGASGWVGSAVVPELVNAGHEVVGLARSDESAAKIAAAGAEVHRGDIEDLASLRAAAATADGVIHTAYDHAFVDMADAARKDREAIAALAEGLLAGPGANGPLLVTSGTAVLGPGRVGQESDPTPENAANPRAVSEQLALGYADRGLRPIVVRLSPTVHGAGDHGFISLLVGIARERGVASYVGDGAARWSAVHRFDAAQVYRLGLEQAPAGSILHAVGEEGIPTREIAEAIGRGLGVPTDSITPEQASEALGFLGMFFGNDFPTSSVATQQLLGWSPTRQGLLADLAEDHYFAVAANAG